MINVCKLVAGIEMLHLNVLYFDEAFALNACENLAGNLAINLATV